MKDNWNIKINNWMIKSFSTAIKGYDPIEVDKLIDEIVLNFKEILYQNDVLKNLIEQKDSYLVRLTNENEQLKQYNQELKDINELNNNLKGK